MSAGCYACRLSRWCSPYRRCAVPVGGAPPLSAVRPSGLRCAPPVCGVRCAPPAGGVLLRLAACAPCRRCAPLASPIGDRPPLSAGRRSGRVAERGGGAWASWRRRRSRGRRSGLGSDRRGEARHRRLRRRQHPVPSRVEGEGWRAEPRVRRDRNALDSGSRRGLNTSVDPRKSSQQLRQQVRRVREDPRDPQEHVGMRPEISRRDLA